MFNLVGVRPPVLKYDVTVELQGRHAHCWLRLSNEGVGILQVHGLKIKTVFYIFKRFSFPT
jgi:hypothetical protein